MASAAASARWARRAGGGQLGGALAEGGGRRQAAAGPGLAGRAFEFGGDVLVEPGRRVRTVPGPAIGIDVRVGGLGEGPVSALALLRRSRPVDRGPGERMTEPQLAARLDEPGRGRRRRGLRLHTELIGRTPYQHRVPERLGRGDEQQPPRRRRKRRQPPPEAFLDPARQGQGGGQPEPARQFLGRQPAGLLKQRERVPPRLGHDPVAYPLVEGTRDGRLEQRSRITVGQPVDHELRQGRQVLLTAGLAHREDDRGRLGREMARHEREGLRRGPVEPVRVVHDADQRPLAGDLRQQAQDGQAHREAIRCVPVPQAERDGEGVALWTRQAIEAVQERRAQLVQPGERELHLGLDARRLRDAKSRRALQQVGQQRGLAGAGLTAQDQHLTLPRPHAV